MIWGDFWDEEDCLNHDFWDFWDEEDGGNYELGIMNYVLLTTND